MKKITLLLMLLTASCFFFAQDLKAQDKVKTDKTISDEEQPEFPGGMKALMTFIAQNVKYPAEARNAGVEGKAYVNFVVETDGSISNAKILQSAGNVYLDNEALRVVNSMPKWKPGKVKGKAVPVKFTLPVNFCLEKKAEPVYNVVENQPEFPGGMKALMKFLRDNIKYPAEARESGVQGIAYVEFIVEADGSISNAKIFKSSGNEYLDKEAVRVVMSMPKWNPGKMQGKAVRVNYRVPIAFRLQ